MQVIRIQVKGNIAWQARQTDGIWTAVCDAMGLTVVGDTWSDLMSTTIEVVDHLLRDLWKTHELERFLSERGWTPVGAIPGTELGEAPRFDLPMSVIQA